MQVRDPKEESAAAAPQHLDLDAIKARCDAATPGPWIQGDPYRRATTHPPVDRDRDTCAYCGTYELLESTNRKRENDHVHAAWDDPWDPDHTIYSTTTRGRVCGNYDYEEGGVVEPADAEFIAHARQDIPALIAEIERLKWACIKALDEFEGGDYERSMRWLRTAKFGKSPEPLD